MNKKLSLGILLCWLGLVMCILPACGASLDLPEDCMMLEEIKAGTLLTNDWVEDFPIYSFNLSDGQLQRLTPDGLRAGPPSVLPNTDKVAFQCWLPKKTAGLCLLDGEEFSYLIYGYENKVPLTGSNSVAWLNSDTLIFQESTPQHHKLSLSVVDVQTGEFHSLVDLESEVPHPSLGKNSLSPDGEYLAFEEAITEIKILNLKTLQAIDVPNANNPTWSPNRPWLAFIRKHDIYRILPDGKEEKLLFERSGEICPLGRLTWTPDGCHLIFTSLCGESERLDLYMLDITTGETELIWDDIMFSPSIIYWRQ